MKHIDEIFAELRMGKGGVSIFPGGEYLAATALFGLCEEVRISSDPTLCEAALKHISEKTPLFCSLAHLLHIPPDKLRQEVLLYIKKHKGGVTQ